MPNGNFSTRPSCPLKNGLSGSGFSRSSLVSVVVMYSPLLSFASVGFQRTDSPVCASSTTRSCTKLSGAALVLSFTESSSGNW